MPSVEDDRAVTVMVMPDGRSWIDVRSMLLYLRRMEGMAGTTAIRAADAGDWALACGASAVKDAIRQLADGFALGAIEAGEHVRGRRRGSRG